VGKDYVATIKCLLYSVINNALFCTDVRAFDWYQNHRPWMTLNGRYALDCRNDASFGTQYKNFHEDRPIYCQR